MRFAAVAVLFALASCKGTSPERPDSPPPPPPTILEVPVAYYVPIPDELLERCNWVRSAPLEDILPVTRGRRYCLEVYEAHIEAIRSLRGSPVPIGE